MCMAQSEVPIPLRLLTWVEDILNWLACTCLAVMTAMITIDSVGRALFGAPLQPQFEMTELYLMPAVAVLSLSRAYRNRAHLSLDLFPEQYLGRAKYPIQLSLLALLFVFSAIVTWRSGVYTFNAWVRDDIYMGVFDWPLFVAYASVPLGFGVLTVRVVSDALLKVTSTKHHKAATGEETEGEEKDELF